VTIRPPAGWANWSVWQYSSSGTVTGISDPNHTDLDQLSPAVLALLDPGHRKNIAGNPVDWRLAPAIPVPSQVPSFSASGLPAGVSVSAAGLVTGWPDTPGTYPVSVTATGGWAAGSVGLGVLGEVVCVRRVAARPVLTSLLRLVLRRSARLVGECEADGPAARATTRLVAA